MILVIQFHDDQSGPHEVECIYNAISVPYHELMFVNARTDRVTPFTLQKYALQADGVILGNLMDMRTSSSDETNKEIISEIKGKINPVLETITKHDILTLASDFSHHLMADFLNAPVIKNPNQAGLDIEEITLTDAGASDPLFQDLNSKFTAIVNNGTSVVELPTNSTLLASSKSNAIQAFRFKKNVYSCQFHTELNAQDILDRPQLYPDTLIKGLDEETSIEAKNIMRRFAQLCIAD